MDLVRIDTFYDPEEAHIALGYLQSHGIDASLGDSAALSNLPELRVALGGFRMLAPENQAGRAKELLAAVRNSDNNSGVRHDGMQCIACGNKRFARVKTWFLPSAITLLFGVPLAWNSGRFRCVHCGTIAKGDVET